MRRVEIRSLDLGSRSMVPKFGGGGGCLEIFHTLTVHPFTITEIKTDNFLTYSSKNNNSGFITHYCK